MLLSTLLSAALTAATFVPGSASDALLVEFHIARAQARAIALQTCAGSVVSDTLERAGQRWVYNFEIRPILPGRANHRISVDANDGAVVSDTLTPAR